MRQVAFLNLWIFIIFGITSCNDTKTEPDAAIVIDQGMLSDQTILSEINTPVDQMIIDLLPDQEVTDQTVFDLISDQAVPSDQGSLITNSGEFCTPPNTCSVTSDFCLAIESNSDVNGMCVASCKKQGDVCPVPNPQKQYSVCLQPYLDPRTGKSGFACLWFCEIDGKALECADKTNFDCKVLKPNFPNYKFCVPKQP